MLSGSYGWGGTGKKCVNGSFVDYGTSYGVGDAITCLLDLEARTGTWWFVWCARAVFKTFLVASVSIRENVINYLLDPHDK